MTARDSRTPDPAPATCDYCRGVGACPRCWGRAAIEELKAQLARARSEGRREGIEEAQRVCFRLAAEGERLPQEHFYLWAAENIGNLLRSLSGAAANGKDGAR